MSYFWYFITYLIYLTCSVNKMSFDCFLVSERLKELYPSIEEHRTPLPRKLSSANKSIFINVLPPYRCEYNNAELARYSKEEDYDMFNAVGSVRASDAIPNQCQFYYFEMDVLQEGLEGRVGIGLTTQGTNLRKMPGWERNTVGYHGDDGHLFNGSSGRSIGTGPTYGIGDVVGCGINLKTGQVVFTKNGIDIGSELFFFMPETPLFPTVAVASDDEKLSVNFGQKSFRFVPSQSQKLVA